MKTAFVEQVKQGLSMIRGDLRATWDRAMECRADHERGYPVSLKEIWDQDVRDACADLRDSAYSLPRSFPEFSADDIHGILVKPSNAPQMDGRSPLQYVCDNPGLRNRGAAILAVRLPIYEQIHQCCCPAHKPH